MERYTGSEIQNDFGILPDLMQTFFRNYDATLGRWTGVDPQADGAESLTVYNYSGNNPIMFNDPLGNDYYLNTIVKTLMDSRYGGEWHSGQGFGYYEDNAFDTESGGAAGYSNNIYGSTYLFYGSNQEAFGRGFDRAYQNGWYNPGGEGYNSSRTGYEINYRVAAVAMNIRSNFNLPGYVNVDPTINPYRGSSVDPYHNFDINEDSFPGSILLSTVDIHDSPIKANKEGGDQLLELGIAINEEVDRGILLAKGISHSGVLKTFGTITGVIGFSNNVYKAWNERHTNKGAALLHFGEAAGQVFLWFSGTEELELLYNLGSYSIDSGIEYYNHKHKK